MIEPFIATPRDETYYIQLQEKLNEIIAQSNGGGLLTAEDSKRVADSAIEAIEFAKNSIFLCGHGTIGATCPTCYR